MSLCCSALSVEQIQEKKVKKICDMNIDPSKATGNGNPACSIVKPYVTNGGCADRSYGYLSKDFSFPAGSFAALHFPTVVVLCLICDVLGCNTRSNKNICLDIYFRYFKIFGNSLFWVAYQKKNINDIRDIIWLAFSTCLYCFDSKRCVDFRYWMQQRHIQNANQTITF